MNTFIPGDNLPKTARIGASTIERRPRIVGVVAGDIVNESGARTKYGPLFKAVENTFPLVEVYNAALQGTTRLLNALMVIHPNRRRWQERFYQNVAAFRLRSQRVARHLRSLDGHADLVVQVGGLFDARWNDVPLPSIIYTDYTMCLSARKPEAGRSPLNAQQLKQWVTLERQAYQRALHICTRGQFVRTSIIEDYGIDPARVTAIGGGVNFERLPQLSARSMSRPPTALFIGIDFYRKGGDLLLQAFAEVRSQVPDARLLLVTGEDIPAALPREGVEVLKPTWDRSAIAALYQQADVFVLPSRLETWGDVLLEAMAYGLPCIGVAGEAMEEIIEHSTTGLIVPANDSKTLADALVRLLGDEQVRLQMGQAARQRLEREYTWDHVVARVASIIERSAIPTQHI